MKRFLLVFCTFVFVLSFCTITFAVNQKNTGCGLGSIILKDQNGLISETCAVTTNGTCANQTFGITSGTLNCEKGKTTASAQKLNKFIADNMDNLAKDIAKGNGEYLSTLAVLMDINEQNRPAFYKKLQKNFSKIYNSEKVTHRIVSQKISEIAKSS